MERFHDKPPLGREPSVELVGPYAVLAEIGRGELTTVYLARRNGTLGFQRLFVLKRLKPALSKNADRVELLLDEARLVSGIHHANIVGVLDVGADAGSFVVMEYIEGENLEALLARAGASRHPRYIVPPFVDALNGLHALHTATEDDGTPCGIVHQAPRARHILLGIDGTARLIDFSQVRGKTVRPTRSRNDRLKVAYMAPEQALHPDGVDLRADLFIAGVALWESLTGERLFAADTDEQTFQNMLHRRVPRPSDVGLRPPRCFDAICMRALERDPKNRYASAQEMARELRDTAQQQALYATTAEVGRWVRHLVGRELRERRVLAGQDAPSSSEISLETPSAGIEISSLETAPARLSDGLTALPGRADVGDENPYATGRIYGGSEARIVLDGAAEPDDKTPAFGMRRGKPLPREEEDDEPTGQHPTGAGPVANALAFDERARAATLPKTPTATPTTDGNSSSPVTSTATLPGTSPPVPAFAAALAETMAPAALRAADGGARLSREDDQTQPTRFVPARPGARRDAASASPGAYSQVDGTRRAQRTRPSAMPAASQPRQLAPAPFDDEADTQRRSVVPSSDSAVREKGSVVPALERRMGTITEHPPTYVQRRDSQPTRMEIPVGPVGVPHRFFAPEHLTPAPNPVVTEQMAAIGEAGPGAWPPLHLRTSLPDSLTPPISAARTAPPRARSSSRSSAVWLVSGVVAALILLAVGVGLRQWVAAGPAQPSTSHTASGGPQLPLPGAQLAEEPKPASEPAALAEPDAVVPKAGLETPPPPVPATGNRPAPPKPKVVDANPAPANDVEAPVVTPAPRKLKPKVVGLPDNPY